MGEDPDLQRPIWNLRDARGEENLIEESWDITIILIIKWVTLDEGGTVSKPQNVSIKALNALQR